MGRQFFPHGDEHCIALFFLAAQRLTIRSPWMRLLCSVLLVYIILSIYAQVTYIAEPLTLEVFSVELRFVQAVTCLARRAFTIKTLRENLVSHIF